MISFMIRGDDNGRWIAEINRVEWNGSVVTFNQKAFPTEGAANLWAEGEIRRINGN